MIRVEVSEAGQAALPPIDIADAAFAIGSSATARVRLPASAARPEHVRIDAGAAGAGGSARGARWQAAGERGLVGDGAIFEIGTYRVRVAPSPAGVVATSQQRTESLARELVRALLGANAAPSLEIERGAHAGARRALAPPESALVIGRGDAAGWVILDADLSKTHAEIRRGWDGVRVFDLDSKNGTRVDRARVGEGGAELRDGAILELGALVLRYRDPAEVHLGGPPRSRPASRAVARTPAIAYIALAVAALAVAALTWLFVG